MTPAAVLVLVAGVAVVLAVAAVAFALDARRRRARQAPAAPPRPARQVEPIDTAQAQQDPPTVLHRTAPTDTGAEDPTVVTPVGEEPDDGAPRR